MVRTRVRAEMARSSARGALIVFEGCDRVGKSTQCQRLVEALRSKGLKAEMMCFPNRSTSIGNQISAYLGKKVELEDHSVHLLFSANRWEMVPEMKRLLTSGVSLVVDRYAFSGVAFTAAKKIAPLAWCKNPDIGLPAPDLVFYLTLPPEVARERGEYGKERYETANFQAEVEKQFAEMKEESWRTISASRTIDSIHKEVLETALEVIQCQSQTQIKPLWDSTELP